MGFFSLNGRDCLSNFKPRVQIPTGPSKLFGKKFDQKLRMVNTLRNHRRFNITLEPISYGGSMKIIIASIVIVVLILVAAFVFNPLDTLAYAGSDEKAKSVDKELISSNTEFAFKIFKEIVKEDEGENIFISPFSISTALAMTYNGAAEETKEAMAKTLEFDKFELDRLNQEYGALVESLKSVDSKVQLSIANSIFIRPDFNPLVKPDFVQRNKDSYDSEVFSDSSNWNPEAVNNWINKETKGKIDKMLEQIDPDMVMFLINAIYFKGDWVTQFDKDRTRSADFFLSGKTVTVDMMSVEGDFDYLKSEDFAAARLPYGRDVTAMYIFLPDEGVDLDSFINNLTQETLDSYIAEFSQIEELPVKLPKFEIEYKVGGNKRLNNVLKKLGMEIAFNPGEADFSGIAPGGPSGGNLYIDFVDHKAVIEVNEEGTEAAVATVVGVRETSARITPIFFVDRPFFFIIRDDRSETILFMGKVIDPSL